MSLESDGGMIYWLGKTEELGEKPVPLSLCPPQIPHGLTRARTRVSAVRGRRLTTWAMARPSQTLPFNTEKICVNFSCPHLSPQPNRVQLWRDVIKLHTDMERISCCWDQYHYWPLNFTSAHISANTRHLSSCDSPVTSLMQRVYHHHLFLLLLPWNGLCVFLRSCDNGQAMQLGEAEEGTFCRAKCIRLISKNSLNSGLHWTGGLQRTHNSYNVRIPLKMVQRRWKTPALSHWT
jgi:hypothetical protein